MQIYPATDKILLPLSPTLAGTIATYLELMVLNLSDRWLQNVEYLPAERSAKVLWQPDRALELRGMAPPLKVVCAESMRIIPTSQYQYVSPIAQQLSANLGLTPLEICHLLQPLDLSAAVSGCALTLDCWYNSAGYLFFAFVPVQIDRWLDYINKLPLDFHPYPNPAVTSLDLAIYAHARCCALLRLARERCLVGLTDTWEITSIDPLCIYKDRLRADARSIFASESEARLIRVLMAVLDALHLDPSSTKSPNWQKLTADLAQSWLEFYRNCRIFGDIQRQNPHLAIARCGLSAIARRYLQLLMENYLGVKAVSEL